MDCEYIYRKSQRIFNENTEQCAYTVQLCKNKEYEIEIRQGHV